MEKIQQEEKNKQREQIEQFYRGKYPESVGNAVKVEPEQKLSPEELQDANQRFSDAVFRANQKRNADTMSKLQDAFRARKAVPA